MQYKDITLMALGILGILLHSLMKIKQLKSTKTFYPADYFGEEWVTMAISLIVIIIAIVCKNEIKQLNAAGNYLGFGFVAIGYMGQSMLMVLMSKVQEKLGSKDDI